MSQLPPDPESSQTDLPPLLKPRQWYLLLATTAIASGCGLASELLLGTLASYLVGNQALAYGVAVGGFLAAMGIGAYLSQFIGVEAEERAFYRQVLQRFVQIELLLGGLTAILPLGLFALFVWDRSLWLGLVLATLILGTLAGTEVPLLTRLVEKEKGIRGALAGVLALDYVGALCGSLLFPLLLLPLLGLFPAAAVIGSLPAWMVFVLGSQFPELREWRRWGLGLGILLLIFAPCVIPISHRLEDSLYQAPIVLRQQSAYQRIVLTRFADDLRLFLDGDLQLSTLDEYRYHEALVHPAMSAHDQLAASGGDRGSGVGAERRVLLLGAGDGMAVREVLKWPQVQEVRVIELDPQVVDLAQNHPFLSRVNQRSLEDPRVQIQIGDAFLAVPQLNQRYDVILADFPDPDREVLAKLYAKGFYQEVLDRLQPDGVFVTQASSAFFTPKVLDSIQATLASLDLSVHPYTINVPSFGPWGFVMAAHQPIQVESLQLPPITTRYLTASLLPKLFTLPADLELGRAQINRLAHPLIVRYQTDPRWSLYN